DLSAFCGSVLQTVAPRLHLSNAALKAGGEGLVGEGGPNDGRENFMQISKPLNGVSEGLLVDLGIFPTTAVADGPVVDGGQGETHGNIQAIKCDTQANSR